MPAQPLLFTPMQIRDVTFKNRVVVAPMHQYAAVKGFATDWHLMNAGRYAAGGAGLMMMESTKVERRGCGTLGDLGLWDDAHIPGLARCVEFIRAQDCVAGIQLGHSGRKARRFRPWQGGAPLVPGPEIDDWEAWELVSSSAVNAPASDPTPRALTRDEVQQTVLNWGQAARRAHEAGFEMLEIHGAHGYLIHQFLSPFANLRNDDYGGTELNRMRFCIEIVEEVRRHWPAGKPLFLRLSVDDDAGWDPDQSSRLSAIVKAKGVDVIDCSSGGMKGSPVVSAGPVTYSYQVPYAAKIRRETGIRTMAVGLIVHADQAEGILQRGEADLIALARELLYNPAWPMDAAQKLGVDAEFKLVPPPQSYWLEKRARQVKELVPSTFREGLEMPRAAE
ncbi:MAG: NADH:flavin oxidoreductase/NADH oxidase [Acetobacteraceae bacterium]|nr:NADH:flavin oxidoreductase/NADH oxidase [Acetobacteraceae bacterium]